MCEERLLQAMAEKQEENAKKSFQSLSPAVGSLRLQGWIELNTCSHEV